MALTTLANVKSFLNIPATNVQEDARLSYLITLAGAAITEFLGRNLESTTYTDYYSGNGMRELRLRQYPVTAVSRVNIDSSGYYNQVSGAFNSAKDLIQGTDYAIVWDSTLGGNPASRRGILERVNGGVWDLLSRNYFSGQGWYGSPYQYASTGKLAREVSTRLYGGNILVSYSAGYSAPLPSDIELAANLYVALLRRTARFAGDRLSGESLGNYQYSIATPISQLGLAPEIGTLKNILNRYREVVI